jgi:signal transduction histidine kinase
VKKLVELHNGRVRAESKGAGNGSIFIVELPAIVKSARPGTDNRKEEKNVLMKRGL